MMKQSIGDMANNAKATAVSTIIDAMGKIQGIISSITKNNIGQK